MDINCPAKRVLIFGSYISVGCRQASRPALSQRQKHDVQSCSLADHEHQPVELCRRCPIVFFQDRGVWGRRCCSRCFPSSTSVVVAAPEKSSGFPSSRVSTPTPVVRDPCCGARTSCLSAASSFAALGQFCLQFIVMPGRTNQR